MIAAPFEKTYLSRAQSRIWSMDNPVGDPYGGPAYGEKNEPVTMIAGIVAIGMGAGAAAAATTTLGLIMAGMMIAGGAMATIGAVSGNKKLSMIGGIVAGVGGLGTAASNMFAEAATTSVVDAGATSAEQMGAQGANVYTAEEIAAMKQVGEQAVQELNQVPTATDVTAGSYQAPNAAYDPSTVTKPVEAASQASNGLINNAIDTNVAGQVADLTPQVANPVDSLTNELTTQFANATQNPLQPSPYESLANASGDTPLVPKPDGVLPTGTAPQDLNTNVIDKFSVENNPNVFDAGYTSAEQVGPQGYIKPTAEELATAQKIGDPNYAPNSQASGSWLDKIEGIAQGIENYKTTSKIGGDLISGAMRYAVPSQSDQAAINLYNAKSNLANQEASAIAALEERKRRQNEAVKNLKPIQLNNASNPIFGNALNGAGIINSARA